MLNQRVFTPNISHKCSKAFPVRYLCRNGRKKNSSSREPLFRAFSNAQVSNFFANVNGISHSTLRKRRVLFSKKHCLETQFGKITVGLEKIRSQLRVIHWGF